MTDVATTVHERFWDLYPEEQEKTYRDVRNVVFDNVNSFFGTRPHFCRLYKVYRNPENDTCEIEFVLRGWDYTIEFREDGSVSMYGVGEKPSEVIEEVIFPELNDVFYNFYDSFVCRMVHIISASQGEYSDRFEWTVSAWHSEAEMQTEILRLTREEPGEENEQIRYYGKSVPLNPRFD